MVAVCAIRNKVTLTSLRMGSQDQTKVRWLWNNKTFTASSQLNMQFSWPVKHVLHVSDAKQLWHITPERQDIINTWSNLTIRRNALTGGHFFLQTVSIDLFAAHMHIPVRHHSGLSPESEAGQSLAQKTDTADVTAFSNQQFTQTLISIPVITWHVISFLTTYCWQLIYYFPNTYNFSLEKIRWGLKFCEPFRTFCISIQIWSLSSL